MGILEDGEPRIACFSPYLHHPDFPAVFLHVLIRVRRLQKEPSFNYALARERFGDTLLQQTSMMIKPASTVARAGGRPPALEAPIPTVKPLISSTHTPRSGRRRAQCSRFPSGGKDDDVPAAYKRPTTAPVNSTSKVQWGSRARLLSLRQVIRLSRLLADRWSSF
jgi:hypothetical protein